MITWYGCSLSYCRALLMLTLQTLNFDPFQVILLFVAVLLVCPADDLLTTRIADPAGELSDFGRQVTLARRRLIVDDVLDHCHCCLVWP